MEQDQLDEVRIACPDIATARDQARVGPQLCSSSFTSSSFSSYGSPSSYPAGSRRGSGPDSQRSPDQDLALGSPHPLRNRTSRDCAHARPALVVNATLSAIGAVNVAFTDFDQHVICPMWTEAIGWAACRGRVSVDTIAWSQTESESTPA
ncbi:hypothetical protein [Streptomyces sp. NPDC005283]|uniref:hypothetical protein n=1 Tax=Streptomyces sp. NPDC005283 TaxID=3156871 RepID=UPI0034555277